MDILNVVKASMPEDLLMACAKFAPIKEYSDGCTIHNRGELKLGLSIIYCGQVKIGNYGLDGKYQHTATLSKATPLVSSLCLIIFLVPIMQWQ
jgi:CRP/FNR family cyclic AMP-dependent transcriptional regulator